MQLKQEYWVTGSQVGKRLDLVLKELLPDYSRSLLAKAVKAGEVLVNGKLVEVKTKVRLGDHLRLELTFEEHELDQPEAMDLEVIYVDHDLIVLNKPSALTVHPGAGCTKGTLLNGLLFHYPELKTLPRGGIVHRLDRGTTGLMVVARNLKSYFRLVKLFQARRITKLYRVLVQGRVLTGGTIEAKIGRDRVKRTLMSVQERGLEAITSYRISQNFTHFTELKVQIHTGRTHQIRVHLQHLGYPVLGDPVYNRKVLPNGLSPMLKQVLSMLDRQMLHASSLAFEHPIEDRALIFEVPLPKDYQQLLQCLRQEEIPGK